MLADLGANVIKIERPPSGDLFRSLTFRNTWDGGTESPNFLAWNRNKRSLALNLKSTKECAVIMSRAQSADFVVQKFRSAVMARLGYDYDEFEAANPKSSISPVRATARTALT